MANFIADQDGKAWVNLENDDGDTLSFALTADQGVAFAPGQAVVIDDSRLDALIETLLVGLPVAGLRRVEQ